MDQPFENDVMDELVAETPHSSADDAYDEYDETENRYDEDDSFSNEMDDYGDSSDELMDLDNHFDLAIHQELSTGAAPRQGRDGLTAAITEALATPDNQAFLRRLSQGLRQMTGQSVRADSRPDHNGKRATRIKSAHQRAAQSSPLARVANLAAQLVREEAEPRDALEAFIELAETDRANSAAVPVIAGLSLHEGMKNIARRSPAQRKQLLQSAIRATQNLAQKQGVQATIAMPRILEVIERNAVNNHLPQSELPEAIQRVTRQVVTNPDLIHRLVHPSHASSKTASRNSGKATKGNVQRLVFDRPVEISIRYL